MSVELKKDTIISHYKILEKIGSGGMGIVYKAEDTKLKRTVALKFLPPEFTKDKEAKKRFIHEARASATLDHPNICNIFEIDETDDGQMFIAMGYYEGETIKQKIECRGEVTSPLPLNDAIDIAIQIAEGLHEAHEKKIIHRDIKSANIIVTDKSVAKILDFGLAKLKGKTKLTKEGTILGTVDYMSPEQAAGEEADSRSDIWSLGVVLYEMVTGQVPFKGEYEQAIMYAIMNEDPEPVTGLRTGIPMELERIINKTLAKDPSERYQGTADLIVDLKKVKKDSKPEVTVAKRKTKPETVIKVPRRILLLGISLLVVLIVVGGYFILKKKPEPEIPKVGPGSKPSLAVLYFDNDTGDKTLDVWRYALAKLLITDLAQSRYINVLSTDQLHSVLKQLKLTEAKNYTTEHLMEIGKRARVNHVLTSSFIKVGDNFAITAQLKNLETNEILHAFKLTAKNENEIFPMVDDLTREIKLELNLSDEQILGDIDKEIGQITTSSPEAFEYYIQGIRSVELSEWRKSISFMEKATKIDPEFAMAYRFMYLAYAKLGYPSEWRKYREKAMQFSHRLPDRERYIIEGIYYHSSEKTWDKTIEAYKKVLQLYPLDLIANVNLGGMYGSLEEWDKAIERNEVLVRNKSESSYPYVNLSIYYQCKGWYEKAREILEYYINNVQDHWEMRAFLAVNYCMQNKFDIAIIEVEKAISLAPKLYQPPKIKGDIYFYSGKFIKAEKVYHKLLKFEEPIAQLKALESIGAAYITQGRLAEAETQFKQALNIAKENKMRSGQLSLHGDYIGYIYFISGKYEKCLKEFNDILVKNKDAPLLKKLGLYFTAVTYLELKSPILAQKAEGELREWVSNRANKKLIRWYYLFQGQKELKKNNLSGAIEYFNKAVSFLPCENSYFKNQCLLFFDALARAYLNSGNMEKAQDQLEKIISLTTGRLFFGDVYAKAFYNLGKIYQEKGWKGKAIENYNKFIELWKNCDPIFQPLVKDAMKRVKELQE